MMSKKTFSKIYHPSEDELRLEYRNNMNPICSASTECDQINQELEDDMNYFKYRVLDSRTEGELTKRGFEQQETICY